MAGRLTRFLQNHPQESSSSHENTCLEDIEFEFLGDGGVSFAARTSSDEICHSNELKKLDAEEEDDDDEDDDDRGIKKNKSFWDDQHQLLQATLCRSSSVESRIRSTTKEALKEIQSSDATCGCGNDQKGNSFFCKKCLLRRVSCGLQSAGYDSAICKTKWRTSPPDFPSGKHTFVDVVDTTNSKKGEVRVIVELNFRAEFEMARASEEYNRLVWQLPEVFVGKVERLRTLIKIMCMAAKRCMKEKKMHMGPWRKQRYMQSKWLGPCERNTSTALISMVYYERIVPETKMKPTASLLTVDLLEKLPNMHCTVVEVS